MSKPKNPDRIDARYVVRKPGASADRWFWQPAARLRAHGFLPQRLNAEGEHIDRLEAAARARPYNDELDAWKEGGGDRAGKAPRPLPRQPASMTFETLLTDHYQQTRRYAKTSEATKKSYRSFLRPALEIFGDQPISAVNNRRRLTRFYEADFDRAPHRADQTLGRVGDVLQVAVKEGWLPRNEARLVERLDAPAAVRGLWTPEAVRVFAETADRLGWFGIGTAWILNEWIGQRRGDLVRMPRSRYRNGSIVFSQRKSRGATVVMLPVDEVPQLRARLAAQLARNDALDPAPTTILVNDRTGRPFTEQQFDRAVNEVRIEAAKKMEFVEQDHMPDEPIRMLDMHAHWLRHTAATRHLEAGNDESRISRITGHSADDLRTLKEVYLLTTQKLSVEAFRLRLEAEDRAAAATAPDAPTDKKVGQ